MFKESRNSDRSHDSRRGGYKRSFKSRGGRSGGGYFSRKRNPQKNKGPKELDWRLFVQKAKPVEEIEYKPSRKYSEIDLHPFLKKELKFKKFEYPTEIQDKTLDKTLAGENILGIADTGTGKTGAFLIPVIDRLLKNRKSPFKTLVIAPTRELANQIEKEFLSLSFGMKLFSVCLTGGTSIGRNLKRLSKFNHIVIGTPGRLIDMAERGVLDMAEFEVLVLDEFDRMLDMGFVDDIKFLHKDMVNLKQTMLFSATVDKKLKPEIDNILADPFEVMVGTGSRSSENVEQGVIKVERGEKKFDKLADMVANPDFKKVLVFVETKRSVDNLHEDLESAGFKADLIHGDKTQRARELALEKFKRGRVQVLVATDVAARGLDIKGVSHVINYEPPKDYETYIHRIGRTGRAGKKGFAFTFVK